MGSAGLNVEDVRWTYLVVSIDCVTTVVCVVCLVRVELLRVPVDHSVVLLLLHVLPGTVISVVTVLTELLVGSLVVVGGVKGGTGAPVPDTVEALVTVWWMVVTSSGEPVPVPVPVTKAEEVVVLLLQGAEGWMGEGAPPKVEPTNELLLPPPVPPTVPVPVPVTSGTGLMTSVMVVSSTEELVQTESTSVDAVGVTVSRMGTVVSLMMVETEVLRIVDTEVPINVAREVLLLTEAWPGSVLAVVEMLSSDWDELGTSAEVGVTVTVEVEAAPVRVEEVTSSEKVVKGVTDRTVGRGRATVECSAP